MEALPTRTAGSAVAPRSDSKTKTTKTTKTTTMMTTTIDDAAAAKFYHPYTPYDVQMQFMKAVYDVCEQGDGQVGILESPTGTGKSLSLICAALTWLRRYKRRQYEAALDGAEVRAQFADEPDWVVEQVLRQRRTELAGRWERREARLAAARRREQRAEREADMRRQMGAKRRRMANEGIRGGATRSYRRSRVEDDEDDEFLLGDGDDGAPATDDHDALSLLSKETRAMMEKAGLITGDRKADADADEDGLQDDIKIYYTSRTHSQLSQFIAELRRPTFPPSMPNATVAATTVHESGDDTDDNGKSAAAGETIKHIPLSSRQRLCINPAVARLGSVAAINDRCAELQKPRKRSTKKTTAGGDGDGDSGRCPYMVSADNQAATHQFRDAALATLPDIEDLYRLGTTLRVCPYYAARTAVPGAEIVTLPYQLLLQSAAREALGIRLDRRNSIVIIDEAHNVMDAVANVHAASVRLSDLRRARQLLEVYVRRFGKRLRGVSRVMVGQLARVIQGLSAWLAQTLEAPGNGGGSGDSGGSGGGSPAKGPRQGIVDPSTLLRHKGADQINLFALVKYVQEAKLAYKVESYAAYIEEQQHDQDDLSSAASGPVLHTLTSFLLALTNLSSEGRIFYEVLPPTSSSATAPGSLSAAAAGASVRDIRLSYLLLSPTHAFASIAASARAVILAGGTMSPFSDYRTHLFPQHAADKITTLSCGHVIPASNLCVWTLASMRPGTGIATAAPPPFDFSFQKRSAPDMIRDLGMALLNLCTVVPDGVVVFFPSYGYLDEVVRLWQRPAVAAAQTGRTASPTMWDRLTAKKAVFCESRGGSSDAVLEAYAQAILGGDGPGAKSTGTTKAQTASSTGGGALLLSVVGGKMSEGINFADRLGRCVVIVGLPFPNPHAPDWKARLEYIEATSTATETTTTATTGSDGSGSHGGAAAARDFYENACMRAVNQSIGRAIRHRNDYAAIVLVDRRFASARIRNKLPGWIRGGMAPASEDKGLSGMIGALGTFFRNKKAEVAAVAA